jgi:hypothetical protein
MPSGRLLRETNPVPGEKPGFIPQHGDGNGNYVETSLNNPLPTSDAVLQSKIDELQIKIDTIQADIAELKTLLHSYIGG